MTVKNFLSVVHDCQWVCVEDNDYEVFAEGEAQELRTSKGIAGLNVVSAYVGNRSNMDCFVVIAERRAKKTW